MLTRREDLMGNFKVGIIKKFHAQSIWESKTLKETRDKSLTNKHISRVESKYIKGVKKRLATINRGGGRNDDMIRRFNDSARKHIQDMYLPNGRIKSSLDPNGITRREWQLINAKVMKARRSPYIGDQKLWHQEERQKKYLDYIRRMEKAGKPVRNAAGSGT